MSLQYADFYEANENWLDWSPNTEIAIKTTYPEFFHGGQYLDLRLFREWICCTRPIQNPLKTKSKDLFKALFKMPNRLIPDKINTLSYCTILNDISKRYGANITAHGVEEQKGGMYNLLLMCIVGCVTVPAQSWGCFLPNMPNISPRGHGPYYIIHSTKPGPRLIKNQPLEEVDFILVPFKENISHLLVALKKMTKFKLITSKQEVNFKDKLVDYETFLAKLSSPNLRKRPAAPALIGRQTKHYHR